MDALETTELGGLTIKIYQDESPIHPRKDCDNLGKMVTWHRRYDLGDEQPRVDHQEYLNNLAIEVDPTVAGRINFWTDGLGWQCLLNKYNTTDLYYIKALAAAEAITEKIIQTALIKCVILPLYLYDHSGITISTGPFSCPWDSNQVGFIYATPEMIRKCYEVKRITKAIRTKVEECMQAEVTIYDQFLTGDVYGFRIEDERGEDLDSCWGFYGIEEVRRESEAQARWYADNRINGMMIDDLKMAI